MLAWNSATASRSARRDRRRIEPVTESTAAGPPAHGEIAQLAASPSRRITSSPSTTTSTATATPTIAVRASRRAGSRRARNAVPRDAVGCADEEGVVLTPDQPRRAEPRLQIGLADAALARHLGQRCRPHLTVREPDLFDGEERRQR